nr:uncharacterized protein LOC116808845 [Taeniopygia guttata]
MYPRFCNDPSRVFPSLPAVCCPRENAKSLCLPQMPVCHSVSLPPTWNLPHGKPGDRQTTWDPPPVRPPLDVPLYPTALRPPVALPHWLPQFSPVPYIIRGRGTPAAFLLASTRVLPPPRSSRPPLPPGRLRRAPLRPARGRGAAQTNIGTANRGPFELLLSPLGCNKTEFCPLEKDSLLYFAVRFAACSQTHTAPSKACEGSAGGAEDLPVLPFPPELAGIRESRGEREHTADDSHYPAKI